MLLWNSARTLNGEQRRELIYEGLMNFSTSMKIAQESGGGIGIAHRICRFTYQ